MEEHQPESAATEGGGMGIDGTASLDCSFSTVCPGDPQATPKGPGCSCGEPEY